MKSTKKYTRKDFRGCSLFILSIIFILTALPNQMVASVGGVKVNNSTEQKFMKPDYTAPADSFYVEDFVISHDSTKIGFRKYGNGPGILLVQGAMGIAYNYHQLALALSKDFTVFVPDRRGRGLSYKGFDKRHSIMDDVEDLRVILQKTGAHFVFGLSSGALITLEACRILPAIQKAIVYEPPFQFNGLPKKNVERFNGEVELHHLPDAMVTAMKIVKVGPAIFNLAPRFLLRFLSSLMFRSEDKKGAMNYGKMKELIPSMRYDFKVLLDRGGSIQLYHSLSQPVLVLGGSKSPNYLKKGLAALNQIIPHVKRIELKGVDHSAPWNSDRGGSPQLVASSIINFINQ